MIAENPGLDKDRPDHKVFTIRIDRTEYEWPDDKINRAQLRRLPPSPIPPNRDIFQVVPGNPDRKHKGRRHDRSSRRPALLHSAQHHSTPALAALAVEWHSTCRESPTIRYRVSERTVCCPRDRDRVGYDVRRVARVAAPKRV